MADGMIGDFAKRAENFDNVICLGASVGSGIGFNLQRRISKVKFGVYAAGGASPSASIFKAPLFFFVRKKFLKNGYDAKKLKSAWKDVEILPEEPPSKTSPFLIVLGKRDKIIPLKRALQTLVPWQKAGVPIIIKTRAGRGHAGTIKWYKQHINELIDEAEAKFS
jgi:hypothetical protein